jgi:hypothetical protein
MKTNKNLYQYLFLFLLPFLTLWISGCDYFFQDPRQILYRPAKIKIEDASGKSYTKLPISLFFPDEQAVQSPGSKPVYESDLFWGKEPQQGGMTRLFSSQEIPYLGGDNCINSLFFDLMGIPYNKGGDLAYLSKEFYRDLQIYVQEPANYFYYKNKSFLKESTYPFINQDQFTVIGAEKMKGGADLALDRFYQVRLKEYLKLFNGQMKTFKITCEYPPQSLGRVKEEVLLNILESKDSFVFLADKQFHMVMRKDNSLRYVSDFSMSKAFFREELQFKTN